MPTHYRSLYVILTTFLLGACSGDFDREAYEQAVATDALESAIEAASGGVGMESFMFPESDDLAAIPADPSNPLTAEKVALGQLLYHDTALAMNPNDPARSGTYSCASCHHADAGFKAGLPQGIAEGGIGFGLVGEGRVLDDGMDAAAAADSPLRPDIQPLTSPATLNVAYQEVMLWNGQFGNAVNGIVNAGVDSTALMTAGTPKAENVRQLAGIETQAVAGLGVHRLKVETDSPLQTNTEYQALFAAAFPNSTDTLEDAGKAIAAYERTLLATEAPFQRWLKGDDEAMSTQELRGAELFFGKANCVACHNGPALSSRVGATESEMFFAIGFADFDTADPRVHGRVDDATSKGRGGLTGLESDHYKFKVPQLYNLTDTAVFGHGASFTSVRDVVAYKNAGVPQKPLTEAYLDPLFTPLGLTESEIDDLTAFLELSLYDPGLDRYVPDAVPSGNCFPVNDDAAAADLGC
ncbi:MAG: cytochrome-c peroxidase [Gammaproteobacteria bacterium]|nr:cytochrome-c peroxidase [Gammaproteobacteria bacterium]